MPGPFECPRCNNFFYGPQCPYCGYAPDQPQTQEVPPQAPDMQPAPDYQPPTQELRCPSCGSDHVKVKKTGKMKCKNCKNKWHTQQQRSRTVRR